MDQHRVLLVRNDILGLQLQDSCLRRHQVVVRVAASEEEALELVQQQPVRMVVMDRQSSGMSAAEFCRAYRALPKASQGTLVLLEDDDDSPVAREFLEHGGSVVVRRQLDPEELGARLARELGLPERRTARVPVQVLVKMELPGLENSRFKSMFANTVDMSLSGVRIEAQHPLNQGMPVKLHMVLPGTSERLSLDAVVRHVVDEALMQYGLEFAELPAGARELVEAFLKRRGAQ